MMTDGKFLCCLILMVITISESLSPEEESCKIQMSIPLKQNQSKIENSLENLKNGENETLECLCFDESCQSLCCPTGQLIVNFYFRELKQFTLMENKSLLEMSAYNDSNEFQDHPVQLGIVDVPFFCQGSQKIHLRSETYDRLPNGSIYLQSSKKIDDFANYFFNIDDDRFVFIIEECIRGNNWLSWLLDKLSVTAVIISIPCLLFTFIVYSVVPELKTIRGATLRGYVAPLAVYYTIIAVVSIAPEIKNTNADLCNFLAVLMYFSGLASFFWLNVMCFHIWWTFERSMPCQNGVSHWNRKKYIMYSIYAWGSASLITGISTIIDFYPNVLESLVRPEFGVKNCFFGSRNALALYFYGPVGFTVVFNTLFFVSTVLKLLKHYKENAHHLRSKDSQCHNVNRQQLNIHLKFYVIMGINWLMDVASYLCNETPQYLWSTTDFINKLQGVIILFMFVLNEHTRKKIRKYLGMRKRKY